jgi:hypothetical protein
MAAELPECGQALANGLEMTRILRLMNRSQFRTG